MGRNIISPLCIRAYVNPSALYENGFPSVSFKTKVVLDSSSIVGM